MSPPIGDNQRKSPDSAHYWPGLIAAKLDPMNANDLHTAHSGARRPAPPSTSPLHDLLMDSVRLGPAPTRAREGAVIVTSVIVIALAVVLLQPPLLLAALIAGAVTAHLAVRQVLGQRRWSGR